MCPTLSACTDPGSPLVEPGSPGGPSLLDWPTNEPQGATPISDQPWDAVGSLGWVHAEAGKNRVRVGSGPGSPRHASWFPLDIRGSPGVGGVGWDPLAALQRG